MEPHASRIAPTSLTRLAARRALEIGRTDPDAATLRKAAVCIRDFAGCCLAALSGETGRSVLALARARPGLPEASHFGIAGRVGAEVAALGNGMLGHALIREDMHVASGAHAGVVILPAMLALAQRERLSGRALLRGVVAGYHQMTALGQAVRTGLAHRHFRPLGISGPFGAAAGAIAATLPDEDRAVHALGFAANLGAGLNEWPWCGAEDIVVHAGMAARNGLAAIDLARAGLRSSDTILEGRSGLFAAQGSGTDAAAVFERLLAASGGLPEVRHKPVAGCNNTQTAIAAALSLRARLGEAAVRDAEQVVIHTFRTARDYPGCDWAGPFASTQQSKMSFQYGVCAALLWGEPTERTYARFDDPALARLLSVCAIRLDPAYEGIAPRAQPGRVEVRTADGRLHVVALDDVPWLDEDGAVARYRTQAMRHADAAAVREADALLDALWEAPDAAPAIEALVALSGR